MFCGSCTELQSRVPTRRARYSLRRRFSGQGDQFRLTSAIRKSIATSLWKSGRTCSRRDHVLSSDGLARARERNGDKHILIIDHYVPTFDRDSGSLRMLNMLQILQDMNYKVSFWPDDLTYDPRYTKTLQDLGIETYYGEMNFEDFISEHGNDLDVVLMSRPATAKKYLHLVKKYSNAQTIFDTVDLHFVREQRRLELEVQQWKNLEFFLAEETDTHFRCQPDRKGNSRRREIRRQGCGGFQYPFPGALC